MTVCANGINIFYERLGAGRPIILIHGNGEDHTIFNETAELLSSNFCVYTPDTRGHGQSTPVAEYNYQDMADDVADFIKVLNIEKPIIYGFSDGGIVGLLVASQHPHILSQLVVSGANTQPQGMKTLLLLKFRIKYFFTRNKLLKLMIKQPNICAADLRKIQVPTLVVAGQYDLIKPEHTRYIATTIPNATLKIVDGEDHESYIVHSTKLYDVVLNPLLYNEK